MSIASLDKALKKTTDLSIGDIISRYGGDKRNIALAAQSGKIDPTKAVMAAMAVDRIVMANSKPPQATVAQEVLGQAMQQAQAPKGMGQIPVRPQMAQATQASQARPAQQPAKTGVNNIPVQGKMFTARGGGIVAFAAGDLVEAPSSLQDVLKKLTYQELQQYTRTGQLPEKYRMMVPGAEPSFMGSVQKQQAATQTTPMSTFAPFESAIPTLGEGVSKPTTTRSMAPKLSPEAALRAQLESEDVSKGQYTRAVKPRPDPGVPTLLAPDLDKQQQEAPPEDEYDYEDVEAPESAAPSFKSIDSYIQTAQDLLPQKEDKESSEDYVARTYKAVQLNQDVFKQQADKIAEKRKKLDLDKNQSINLRIIEMGLGILGGKSANAFENIKKGATPGLQGMIGDIKEIRKLDAALDDLDSRLAMAQYSDKKADARLIMQLDKDRKKAQSEREIAIANLAVGLQKVDLQALQITETAKAAAATREQTGELRRLGYGVSLGRNEEIALKNALAPIDKQIESLEQLAIVQQGKLSTDQQAKLDSLKEQRRKTETQVRERYARQQRNVSGTSEFSLVR